MFRQLLLPAVLLAGTAIAQTWTECNPLNSTCPDDVALGTTYTDSWNQDSTQLNPQLWNITAGAKHISFGEDGAAMAMYKTGDSATAQSNFHIFWGEVDVQMKAASGTGIISTFILLSDDLDEIDLEIMGGNHTHVATNWYGHGNTEQMNSIYVPVDGPQDNYHNYTFRWDQNKIDWLINGNIVRTVPYAKTGLYPQTPSFVRFGVWPAGDKGQPEGTIKWAGGPTDWSQGPFVMHVKSIKVVDGTTNSTSYSYGDNSGSWQSIKINKGTSKAYEVINKQSTAESAKAKWNGLSQGAKIGIAAGIISVFAIAFIAFLFYCFKQRRAGKAEKLAADRQWEQQHAEMLAYRNRMAKGGFAVSHMGHGEKF